MNNKPNYSLEFIARYDQLINDGKRSIKALGITQYEFKNKIYKIEPLTLSFIFIDNTGCCLDAEGWDLFNPKII